MAVTAKSFAYAAAQDRAGRVSADNGPPGDVPADWKPEHLVLAGLVRCTLASLRYHARYAGIDDVVASAAARGRVTKREEDERYAFVEIDCDFDVELDSRLAPAEVAELVAKAERDCFVGASLTPSPRYRWTVNGEDVPAG
ncbi:MAG: OsmC family protein [Actinomycetota bacterium]|nr:OsmC family protein [Actinomycetota bacterium]